MYAPSVSSWKQVDPSIVVKIVVKFHPKKVESGIVCTLSAASEEGGASLVDWVVVNTTTQPERTAMTQYQVTLNPADAATTVQRRQQLAQLLESMLNQVLDAQVSEHLQADRYERTKSGRGIATATSRASSPRGWGR